MLRWWLTYLVNVALVPAAQVVMAHIRAVLEIKGSEWKFQFIAEDSIFG